MSNHVIYDRIWESRKLAQCSLKAALAYPWIYLVADDWGRFEYLPRVVWGKVFGSRKDVKASDVERWLNEYRRVGLLFVYGMSQKGDTALDRSVYAQWSHFTGPPPSKRRASFVPRPDGGYDSEGLKGETRFHSAARSQRTAFQVAADSLPLRSPETGNGKRETGNEKREGTEGSPSRPSRSPDQPSDDHARQAVAQEVLDLAAKIAERTSTDPKTWVIRASSIPAQDGRPGKSFEDPRRRGLSVSWLQTTARKLREFRDETTRPPPL